MSGIDPLNGERIGEGVACHFEGDAVIAQVLDGLGIVPLEIFVLHKIRDTRILCKCPALLKNFADKDDRANMVVMMRRVETMTGQTIAIDSGRYLH